MLSNGPLPELRDLHAAAMKSKEYLERHRLLTQARDLEIYTSDIRAKSVVLDYLRQLRRKNVHVLDLESALVRARIEFGANIFTDYFHFNKRGHAIIERHLFNLLERTQVLQQPLSNAMPSDAKVRGKAS
jgi:hypothetical protein